MLTLAISGSSTKFSSTFLSVELLRLLKGEYLGDPPDPLGPPVPEEQPLADLEVLGAPQELEDDGGRVVGANAVAGVDGLDDGRLTDRAHVDGGAEEPGDLRRVVENADLGLEREREKKLVPTWLYYLMLA